MMQSVRPAHLVLEDGTVFEGSAVGAESVAAGEACFTTAMAGYEEAATDPSYVAQVLAFSYPLVGNYGVDRTRLESERVQAEGIVMRRARPAWAQWLASQGVVALEDVDTRALVRKIRDGGVLRCALGEAPVAELHARAMAEPPIDGRPLGRAVGTAHPYRLGTGPRITVLDLGTKRSIPARLAACGLEVLIVLGHQILGLALGLETFKLPFGHRGANHPVRDLKTGRVLVTVQNHGFAVADSGGDMEVTHVSLNDGTVEGF